MVAYLKPHEIKTLVDDAVSTLIDACDTDSVYWDALATGQDSEEAESSGYLQGYRDALAAMQQIVGHGNAEPLRGYLAQVREEMYEQQREVEDNGDYPGPHFWNS